MKIDFRVGASESFEYGQLNSFLDLLIKQGQVQNPSIEKIKQCPFLCIAYEVDKPIGIGAIKQVYKTPFIKAEKQYLADIYKYELGYVFLLDEERYRKKGIAKAICNLLLGNVDSENVFATTEEDDVKAMKFLLKKLGFTKEGKNYTGRNTGKQIGLYLRPVVKRFEEMFDDHLLQTLKAGLSHDEIERGIRYEEFQQVGEWKLKYGYRFNVYSNDHLINGKKHFHFDNAADSVHCKMDFEGNVLESSGRKAIQPKILKELQYFVAKPCMNKSLNDLWNDLNPNLTNN